MRINLLVFILLTFCLTFSTSCYIPHNNTQNVKLQDSLNQGGTAIDRFAIVGNNLYVAFNSSIKVYDIHNPSLPTNIGNVNMTAKTLSIQSLADSFIVVGTSLGEELYNIAKSNLLQNYMPIPDAVFYDPMVYKSNYLYGLVGIPQNSYAPNAIIIYNQKIGPSGATSTKKNIYLPKDLAIDSNNNLFICDSGLKVFDVSISTNINLIKHFNVEANKIKAYNDNLVILGNTGLYQYQYINGSLNLLSKINIIPTP